MKAWICRLLPDYECATVVFAETRGKAKVIAMCSDSLGDDVQFIDIEAQRIPKLDKYYRGLSEMDWYDPGDRFAMVKIGQFRCDVDTFDPDLCEKCSAKDVCEEYADYLSDEARYQEEMARQSQEGFDENGDPLKDFEGNPW